MMLLRRVWAPVLGLGLLVQLTASAHAGPAGFRIVSDIDDTIKITNVRNLPSAIYHGIFGREVFAGMPELYREWVAGAPTRTQPMSYLSGSPELARPVLRSLLFSSKRFPDGPMVLKDWIQESDTRAYKLRALAKISAWSEAPMILVGDDTEQDPELFAEFAALNPGRVLKIYIRWNVRRALPDGVVPFYSAWELALSELEDGRLTPAQAIRVGQGLLREKDFERVIPDFSHCPDRELLAYQPGPATRADSGVMAMLSRVSDRVFTACLARNHELHDFRETAQPVLATLE